MTIVDVASYINASDKYFGVYKMLTLHYLYFISVFRLGFLIFYLTFFRFQSSKDGRAAGKVVISWLAAIFPPGRKCCCALSSNNCAINCCLIERYAVTDLHRAFTSFINRS